MEECDEIRRRSETHSRLVTIYRTEQITLAEHLIRARCSHLSPLRAGMEEFALFVLPCFTVLSHVCCFLHIRLSSHVTFSFGLCPASNYGCISSATVTKSAWKNLGRSLDHILCKKKQLIRNRLIWWHPLGTHKHTAHDLSGYCPGIKHIDYSMGLIGESGGPNLALKAFPNPKENYSAMKRHHLKMLKCGTKCENVHFSLQL